MISDTRIPSRFALLRELGVGATGRVYEARDAQTGAHVALKILRELDSTSRAATAMRFQRAKQIRHPNVVRLDELFVDGEVCFFTMELVAEHDLGSWLRPGTLDDARLRSALRQLASALDALHEVDLVHRDVKTANVRVDGDGRVVLLDLDLAAKPRETAGDEGTPIGTPAYMAPEQAAGVRVDGAADQYALGVVLYEALTGRVPFEGSALEILLAKQRREPQAPSAIDPRAPEDLSLLCLQLLRFEPWRRPTAAAIVRRLDAGGRLGLTQTGVATVIGRDAILARLHAGLIEVDAGDAVLSIVEGGPAMGKSALLDAVADGVRASRPEALVLRGSGREDGAAPFRAWAEPAERLAEMLLALPESASRAAVDVDGLLQLVTMLPALRRPAVLARATSDLDGELPAYERRWRAFVAFREILKRHGRRSTIVLLLDDLDEADDDSLALLHALLRPPEAPAILAVVTATDGASLASRLAALAPRHERLDPLDARDAEALVRVLRDRLGDVAGAGEAGLASLVSASAGIPGRAAALMSDADAARASTSDTATPELFRPRIAALASPARELLRAVALAETPLPLSEWTTTISDDTARVNRDAGLLVLFGLCRGDTLKRRGALELRHRFVGDVALAEMTPVERNSLASRVCTALGAMGNPPLHALASLRARTEGATEVARRASERAAADATARLAFATAAENHRAHLALLPASHESRKQTIHVALAESLAAAGSTAEAAEAYEAAAALGGRAAATLALQRRAAENLLRSGQMERGAAMLRATLRASGLSLPSSRVAILVQFLFFRCVLWLRGMGFREREAGAVTETTLAAIDTTWSIAFGLALSDTLVGALCNTRLLLLALRTGEPVRVARALGAEVGMLGSRGGPEWKRTERIARDARALAERTGDAHAVAWTTGAYGLALYCSGYYRASLEHCRTAAASFRGHDGSAWELSSMHYMIGLGLRQLGEMKELARTAAAYLADARNRGDLDAEVHLRAGYCATHWLASDDPARVLADADDVERRWKTTSFQVVDWMCIVARVDALLYEGRASDAHAALTRVSASLRRSLLLRVQIIRLVWFDLWGRTELALAFQGDAPSTRIVAAKRCADRIATEAMAWTDGLASLIHGGAALAEKSTDAGARAFERATKEFDGADMALYAAIARHRLGEIVGGDEGASLMAASNAWCAAAGIVNPERMRAMLSPIPTR